MKVCLLNESFPPVLDGVANVVVNYAEHMTRDHGIPVIVGTPAYPGADYSGYGYPIVPYDSFATEELASGYRAGNPLNSRHLAQLADFRPDIIHSHCPASATVMARLLREDTDAPVVFTYHTKYDIDIERWVKVRSIAQEGISAMVGNIEACDEIWTVSKGAGESLKALGFQGDYRVMSNGVDFEKGRVDPETVARVTGGYDLPAGVPMFLFVGRLMTYKGLPLILDALKPLADRGVDFRMVFIGKGPDQQLLEDRAVELGIASRCIFVGPVYDRDALRAWNTRADLFLFPSTFDTNGLVVREAAACGLASALIRGSCAAEGITDGRNGFLIDETPQSLTALLMQAAGNLPMLRDVGQHAMDEIYLSWKDCVTEVVSRYETLLERKRSGLLTPHRKMITDYLIAAASRSMEEQEKVHLIRDDLFDGFKDTASGMLDNSREADFSLQKLTDRLSDRLSALLHRD